MSRSPVPVIGKEVRKTLTGGESTPNTREDPHETSDKGNKTDGSTTRIGRGRKTNGCNITSTKKENSFH